ncbi:uncharacterized Zn finger protein (UPF0148 family) [Sphingopyxis panaciterrae]|uniref:zinc-ribbon domain-containing protein n=1 Tax=Sphingopyxis panaciterrae TaxID=363841 RepID=UPI001422393A|nr:zinc-ribbon domain-containing protein [Sphingopyxis panaciterrae]NIJ38086.1 uncharacterized Zn finger protein (UPF0148 family) [Sphingopyxis panaciterrae]
MANFCSECGSPLSPGARFCAACGAAIEAASSEAAPAAEEIAPLSRAAHESPLPDSSAVKAPPVSRKPAMILTGAALLAVAIGGGAWLGLASSGDKAETGQEAAPDGAKPAGESASLFAVAEANLRNAPTLDGSKVVGSLKRGEKVTGTLVTDERGKQWLKVDGTGRFVSLANLANDQPPTLATLDGSDRIATAQCPVLETAAAASATKMTLKPGAAIRLVGTTADGFAELGLPGGGVGYTPASAACATDPSPAKGAVANSLIQFDPRTCELGAELEPYFEKARNARDQQGVEEMEEEYSFPVDKRFHGLRVTSVIVGYEWQGVAFGDPASKVQAAFREMGFKIEKNGSFTVADDVDVATTIRPADASVKSRGQSELICGI